MNQHVRTPESFTPISTKTANPASRTKRKERTRAKSQYDRYPLPFFDKAERLTWAAKPTGDYAADCKTGNDYARQFLATCDGSAGWETLLSQIVSDIVRMGPAQTRPDGSVSCGGIVIGFMCEIGRALIAGERARHAATAPGPSKWEGFISDATGFAPDVPVAAALAHHAAAQAVVDTMTVAGLSEGQKWSDACDAESNALLAVKFADVSNLEDAGRRAVYLENYWRTIGDGEGENAWPFLSPAIAELARFIP